MESIDGSAAVTAAVFRPAKRTATPFLLQPNRGQVCNNNNIQDKEVLYTASDEGMELFCYKDKLRLLLTTQPALVWINYPNQLGAMETENGKLRSKEIGKLKQDENYKSNTMIISNTRYYYYYEANPTISINL